MKVATHWAQNAVFVVVADGLFPKKYLLRDFWFLTELSYLTTLHEPRV